MKLDSLPTGYIAPEILVVGSNKLERVSAILEVNGNIPILFGDGETPHVWLYIPANNEGTEWYPLIRDNVSSNPEVIVMVGKNSVKIATPKGDLLECQKRNDGVIEVSKLDLRIVGLDFIASNESITFMTNTFSSNTFTNARVMFSVGSPENQPKEVK